MNFNYIGNTLEPLETIEVAGARYYVTPAKKKYPSVTTVLGYEEKDGITKWKKRVGSVEAKRVLDYASELGTAVHKLTEYYLLNQEQKREELFYSSSQHARVMFNSFTTNLDKINNIVALEAPLYSNLLKLAGRTDCIAEYKNVPAIIDFKTSKNMKEEWWIENYFMQGTAYSLMYQELTKKKIEDIVILMVNYDCSLNVYHKKRDKYIKPLLTLIKRVLPNFGENLEL